MSNKGIKRKVSDKFFQFTKIEETVAKAIYESMYPDSKWENLDPNRDVRFCRLRDARAAIKAYRIAKHSAL